MSDSRSSYLQLMLVLGGCSFKFLDLYVQKIEGGGRTVEWALFCKTMVTDYHALGTQQC